MLVRLARLLVMVGQLALLIAVGTEGMHGASAASHIERSGIDQHYAHNEATCIACTVLSLHARGESRAAVLPAAFANHGDAPMARRVVVVVQRYPDNHPSRAPPAAG